MLLIRRIFIKSLRNLLPNCACLSEYSSYRIIIPRKGQQPKFSRKGKIPIEAITIYDHEVLCQVTI